MKVIRKTISPDDVYSDPVTHVAHKIWSQYSGIRYDNILQLDSTSYLNIAPIFLHIPPTFDYNIASLEFRLN